MENENNCLCDQLTVIKKGFSGLLAICGFFGAVIISTVFIFIFYPYKNPDLYIYILCAVFIVLSLLLGTFRMNKLYTVCAKCGKKIPLN